MSQYSLPPYEEWISDLNLSSPVLLERIIDKLCTGIKDRLNPANEKEYIRVMQCHLMLEVWSQIRVFINEQFQKQEYFSHARITNLNKNVHNKHVTTVYKGCITVHSHQSSVPIPPNSFVLLLWRSTEQSVVNLRAVTDELKMDEFDESDQFANASSSSLKSVFPPHVLVQVISTSCKAKPMKPKGNQNRKKNKQKKQARVQHHTQGSEWSLHLNLNEHSYELMQEYKQSYRDYILQVVPVKNLIYLQRDYDAVRNVNRMPLSLFIFGKDYLMTHKCRTTENLLQFIQNDGLVKKYFHRRLNASQFHALQQSLIKPLTLIHGPPGTGKTKYALLPILKCTYFALSLKYDALNRKWFADLPKGTEILPAIKRHWLTPNIGVFTGSNQAIDQVILTILEYDQTQQHKIYSDLPILRIGNTTNINPTVAANKVINVNQWIEHYLAFKWDAHTKYELTDQQQRIQQRKNLICTQLKQIEASLHQLLSTRAQHILHDHSVWHHIRSLVQQGKQSMLELACLTAIEKYRYPNQAQRTLLPILINASQIVCSTANYLGRCTIDTSTRGHNRMDDIRMFDAGLFDECCQMRETETLIALQYCRRAVLVGDPKQLQSTIFYHGKYRNLLTNSLFVRVEKYVEPIMLNEQYRMNAEIALFPSLQFYGGQLLNGANVQSGQKQKQFHVDASGLFRPYLFFDVIGVEESRTNSLMNQAEIDWIEHLLTLFAKNATYLKEIQHIGIITPYLAQKQCIQAKLAPLQRFLLENYRIAVECVTVDEFQGSERDIIIFSCVRSNQLNNVGFLNDESRLNVAITRAKYALWMVGNMHCLTSDAIWKALIENAHKRGLLISQNINYVNETNHNQQMTEIGNKLENL